MNDITKNIIRVLVLSIPENKRTILECEGDPWKNKTVQNIITNFLLTDIKISYDIESPIYKYFFGEDIYDTICQEFKTRGEFRINQIFRDITWEDFKTTKKTLKLPNSISRILIY